MECRVKRWLVGAGIALVVVSILAIRMSSLDGTVRLWQVQGAQQPNEGMWSSPLPRSMKGYELYSWPVEGEDGWHHVLMTGTNRLKTEKEILAVGSIVTESGWVKLHLKGTEGLKVALGSLPQGETVSWIGAGWLERVGGPQGAFQLPSPEVIKEIENYCRHLGIQIQVTD